MKWFWSQGIPPTNGGARSARPTLHYYSFQPSRYSRYRYLFAPATLVMASFWLSSSTFFPARSATVPRLTASVIGPALAKLPGDGSPPWTARSQEL